MNAQPRKVRKTCVGDRQNDRQTGCKHIVPSGFTGGVLITTWSDVESTLESSQIIFSSVDTLKSDMKKASFIATVPGSYQVNRDCVTTKEWSGENSITTAMNVGNIHWEINFDGHMNAHRDNKPCSCAHYKKSYGYSRFPSFGFGPVLDYFACFAEAFLQKRDKWNETYMLWKSIHLGIKTCKNYCSRCRIDQIDNDFHRVVSFTLLVPPCFGLQRKRYFNVLHKKGDCKH